MESMDFLKSNILTIVTFLPLLGALLIILLARTEEGMRRIALGTTILTFLVSLPLINWYTDPALKIDMEWIKVLGVKYHMEIDGLSLWLVILSTFLVPVSILSSWTAIHKRVREYLVFLLLLETGMIGVFLAMDMILFYLFWEVMLIPMYFLIGVWGGERRIYAAIKFVLYTLVGSLLMLVAMISLYLLYFQQSGVYTFDMAFLSREIASGRFRLDLVQQSWMFAAFALAFLIKVPLFPLHTWLPDAHVEAPTAGSVLLAGVLLKMGTYGLLRFNLPMFPDASHRFAVPIMILAVIGIIYGALVAMVQPDLKKLIAYSSVSHLGFVVLGIFAFNEIGMQGALYQMLNHGISTGALFLIVGVIYERRHTRLISEFGGLATPMPLFATIFLIVTFSSIGLPLLNGFVGEFLILLGSFNSIHSRVFTILATTGVILSAVYMLWMIQRVVFGEVTREENRRLTDLNLREKFVLVPLVLLIIFMGVYPNFFLSRSAIQIQQVQSVLERTPTASNVR
jgi:NADH-quinone oxidoreductase subunit M